MSGAQECEANGAGARDQAWVSKGSSPCQSESAKDEVSSDCQTAPGPTQSAAKPAVEEERTEPSGAHSLAVVGEKREREGVQTERDVISEDDGMARSAEHGKAAPAGDMELRQKLQADEASAKRQRTGETAAPHHSLPLIFVCSLPFSAPHQD